MLRWMCGHTKIDLIMNEDVRDKIGMHVWRLEEESETEIVWACEEEMHKYPSN